MSSPRPAPEHLAQRHLAGALGGAGGREVDEVHHRHAEDQQSDHAESGERAPVAERHERALLGVAEMDVGDRHQLQVEDIGLARRLAVDELRRDRPFLPRRQRRVDRRRVGAGPKLHIMLLVHVPPALFAGREDSRNRLGL